MTAPRLVLKQSTGWFAAGGQFGEALVELSDAAFKLYTWLCLNVDRYTGQLRITRPALSSALRKPAPWIESTVEELRRREVCRWVEADVLEVADRYWPYEKQRRWEGPLDFVGEVRRMLLAPACLRSNFTPADERLAWDLDQRGVSLDQLQRATCWAVPASTSPCSTARHRCP
jgi:hypothetical protein